MEDKQLPENIRDDRGALAKRSAGVPAPYGALARMEPGDLARLDKISIEGLEVFANHGVYAAETELGQKFVVSLVLYCDVRAAGVDDDLSESVDYGAVAHAADAFLREHTFKLIEAAAEGLAREVLERFPLVFGVRVRIEKPWAPIGLPLKTAAIEIERTR